MAQLKFLDLETGLPRLWQQVLAKLETHNTSTVAHQDMRDTISSLTTTVNNKVTKETGKGLSTNDYTSAEKTKLSGIAEGANKTVVDSSLSTTSTNPVQNKVINAALNSKAATSTTDSLQSSINTLNTKVATAATQSAMGMMSAADKTKLDGIATGANKITIDSALSSSSTNPVQNKVINTALAAKATTDSVKTVSDALNAFKSTKGAASGLAPLNASSKIDSTYLPSYVDDVLEYTSKSNFPSSGETGKIYVDTGTNLTYRWSGTAYVEISPSIALGTTSSTAFRGDYGNAAYSHATAKGSAFSNGFYKITTNNEGHVTAVSAVSKSDLTNLGVMDASSIVPISKGGTGASSAATALSNLGGFSLDGGDLNPRKYLGIKTACNSASGSWNDEAIRFKNYQGTKEFAYLGAFGSGAEHHYLYLGYGGYYNNNNLQITPDGTATIPYLIAKKSVNSSTGIFKGIGDGRFFLPDGGTFSYSNINSGSTEENTAYNKAIIKQIATEARSVGLNNPHFIATKYFPNSYGFIIGNIYHTDNTNADTGLPQYSTFLKTNLNASCPAFIGTNKYELYEVPILTSKNYNSYSPSLTGTGASGTWNIISQGVIAASKGEANVNRHVWFSDNGTETKRNYNDNFQYNPYSNVLTVGSITGSAAKLTTARQIKLTGGGMLYDVNWSFDGSNNVTATFPGLLANSIGWSYDKNYSSQSPIGYSVAGRGSYNLLHGLKSDYILTERTDDGGATWYEYSGNTANLTNAWFTGLISNSNSTSSKSANAWHRVTLKLKDASFYGRINALQVYLSTNGASGTTMLVECLSNDGTTWNTIGSFNVSGWSGHNYIIIGDQTFGSSYSPSLRLTFKQTGVNGTYANDFTVSKILAFGVECWHTISSLNNRPGPLGVSNKGYGYTFDMRNFKLNHSDTAETLDIGDCNNNKIVTLYYDTANNNKGLLLSGSWGLKFASNDMAYIPSWGSQGSTDTPVYFTSDGRPVPINAVSIAHGGTGSTTAVGALTNLGAVAKAGDTMTGSLNVGTTSTTSEINVCATAASGSIYFYATGSSTGNRGIYAYNANGASTDVIRIDSSNGMTFFGNSATANKVNNALTISLNGSSQGAYDGSAAKSINITPSAIGAAASSHTHSYLPLSGGTLTGSLLIGNSSDSATSATDAGITIRDLRNCTITPSSFNRVMTPYFHAAIGGSWNSILHMKGWSSDAYAAWELAGNARTTQDDNLYFRSGLGTSWNSWRTLLHSNNYTNYTVTKTGSGASGTWGINISGNAASADKLEQRSLASSGSSSSGYILMFTYVAEKAYDYWAGIYSITNFESGTDAGIFCINCRTNSTVASRGYEKVEWISGAYNTHPTLYVTYEITSSSVIYRLYQQVAGTWRTYSITTLQQKCSYEEKLTLENTYVTSLTGTLSNQSSSVSADYLRNSCSIQTNLGSTSTAYFNGTSNITPGVTGTLPITNGGTGATSASGARTNLGISHTTSSDNMQQVSKFGDFQIITGFVTGVAVNSSSYQDVVVSYASAFSSTPCVVVGLQSGSTAGTFGRVNAALRYTGSTTELTIRVANGDTTQRAPNLTFIAVGKI